LQVLAYVKGSFTVLLRVGQQSTPTREVSNTDHQSIKCFCLWQQFVSVNECDPVAFGAIKKKAFDKM